VAQLEKRLDETPTRKAKVAPSKEVRVCHLVNRKRNVYLKELFKWNFRMLFVKFIGHYKMKMMRYLSGT